MLKRLIGTAALWAGRVRGTRAAWGAAASLALLGFLVALSGVGPDWLGPAVTTGAAIWVVRIARRALRASRARADMWLEHYIAASLRDEILARALDTWSKRYL